MKNLTNILDRAATELEARGLRRLAAELDVVTNTIEKMAEGTAAPAHKNTHEFHGNLKTSLQELAAELQAKGLTDLVEKVKGIAGMVDHSAPAGRLQGRHGTHMDLYPGSGYDPTAFERPTLTVDIALFRKGPTGATELLTITRGAEPDKGKTAFPGGFVDINKKESAEMAAERELWEETNIKGLKPVQFKAFTDRAQHKMVRNGVEEEEEPRWYTATVLFYYALNADEALTMKPVAGDDAAKVQWIDVHGPEAGNMALGHSRMLKELIPTAEKSLEEKNK